VPGSACIVLYQMSGVLDPLYILIFFAGAEKYSIIRYKMKYTLYKMVLIHLSELLFGIIPCMDYSRRLALIELEPGTAVNDESEWLLPVWP
jgi:hypothetical protein